MPYDDDFISISHFHEFEDDDFDHEDPYRDHMDTEIGALKDKGDYELRGS